MPPQSFDDCDHLLTCSRRPVLLLCATGTPVYLVVSYLGKARLIKDALVRFQT